MLFGDNNFRTSKGVRNFICDDGHIEKDLMLLVEEMGQNAFFSKESDVENQLRRQQLRVELAELEQLRSRIKPSTKECTYH